MLTTIFWNPRFFQNNLWALGLEFQGLKDLYHLNIILTTKMMVTKV